MGMPTIYIGENKCADQLRSNCEADQRICFRYKDSTLILLLLKSKISSFKPATVTVQTWSEPKLFVFSHTGSYMIEMEYPAISESVLSARCT